MKDLDIRREVEKLDNWKLGGEIERGQRNIRII